MRSYVIILFCGLIPFLFAFTNKQTITKKNSGWVYIPSGTFSSEASTYSVNAMFMADHEVTNVEYREFLVDLKKQNRLEEFEKCIPDSAAWNIPGAYTDPMMNMYFSHPVYNDYPVVNISVEAAELYCRWLQEKLKSTYGPEQIGQVRLPTSKEWIYAAAGGSEGSVYSWNDSSVRDSDGKFLGNFKQIGDEFITTKDSVPVVASAYSAGYFMDGAFFMALSKSYAPNGYGLYNMSGNVSELVKRQKMDGTEIITEGYSAIGGNWNSTGYDVRITSEMEFEKPNPFAGFRPVMTVFSGQ